MSGPASGDPEGRGPEVTVTVEPGEQGPARLDRALVAALKAAGHTVTRSRLAAAFERGEVRGPEDRRLKASTSVEAPLLVRVRIPVPEPLSAEPEDLPIAVLYEDEHLLVIDKAAGMPVHPGPGHPGGTLVNAVLHHLGRRAEDLPVLPGNEDHRPGIVHRLDKDTSGVLVVALHAEAQEGLAAQFRAHDLERRYLGIVLGDPAFERRTVETGHARDPADRRRYAPDRRAPRRAVTHVEVVMRLGVAAVVGFTLETGRTHQIRMHARHLGHPILADALYGHRVREPELRALCDGLGRHALHAQLLGIRHPIDGRPLRFVSPLPPELAHVVRELGGDPDAC